MLTISQVTKSFGARTLISDVSLQVNRGNRIGLIGPNGAGKSTLFSLILGQDSPDEGIIAFQKSARIGYLPQESLPAGKETILELVMFGGSVNSSGAKIVEDLDHQREAKAKRILSGLAFRERDFTRPAAEFSGGWIIRAHLARLLVAEPDLLLLDEPTNHLDLQSVGWLQNYLREYTGAIVLVSHDRAFLNAIVRKIIEFDRGKLLHYQGDYEAYLGQRTARREQQLAAFKNQQREIAKLQTFIDRFGAKNTKADQAQSKRKQIERMEKIEAPEPETASVHFRFPQPARSGARVLELKHVEHAYGELLVYRNFNLTIERGQKTVLVGPNGAGKSTLLKLLAGVLPLQRGERELGHNVKVGYFSQYRVDMLDPKMTVLETARDMPNPVSEQVARTVLGSFLFRGDDVFKTTAVLSGGEKTRLALVKLLLDPPNLLLMDETTTHLDVGSIDALVGALGQYHGTLIFISHDVHFIRAIATSVLHVTAGANRTGGKLTFYPGDYDYYLDKSKAASAKIALTAGSSSNNGQPVADNAPRAGGLREQKAQKRLEAQSRNAIAKARREKEKRVHELETKIAALEGQQKELAAALEDPAAYTSGGHAIAINRDLSALSHDLARLTAEWESVTATVNAP